MKNENSKLLEIFGLSDLVKDLTKNDIAWMQIFYKYKILEEILTKGYYKISSSVINEYRQSRLMAKFDSLSSLPNIFKKYSLSILPISRGEYIISNFNCYYKFNDDKIKEIIHLSPPSYIESINFENITSESVAINAANAGGILEHFLEDKRFIPTVNGRMGSGNFEFKVGCNDNKFKNIIVDSAQIEIDAAYEGEEFLSIFEAKMNISDDFIIRQLYYPYRTWTNKKINKKIKNIYLTYSNGIYTLSEYEFLDEKRYDSIQLVKSKKYTFDDITIGMSDVLEILTRQNCFIKEPNIAFPQANSFERIINLCELLSNKDLTREEITENYGFDTRQTSYYTDACIYLNLVEKLDINGEVCFSLKNNVKEIFKQNYKKRQLFLIERILEHEVFNKVLKSWLNYGEYPDKDKVVDLMRNSNLYRIKKDSTFSRRSSTIKSWCDWIVTTIDEND